MEVSESCDNIIEYPFKHTIYHFTDIKLLHEIASNFNYIKKYNTEPSENFRVSIENRTILALYYRNNAYVNSPELLFIKSLPCMEIVLDKYIQTAKNMYKKYNNREHTNIKFQIMFVCDVKGYFIGPHTDTKDRNCTMVTYITEDNNENAGLGLYVDTIDRHKKGIWKVTHYPFDNFEQVKQVPYYLGSSCDFKVSSHSFHAVKQYNCNRSSIQLLVYN